MDFGELNLSDFSRRSKSLEGSEGERAEQTMKKRFPCRRDWKGAARAKGRAPEGQPGLYDLRGPQVQVCG